jgi:hypothetical protein
MLALLMACATEPEAPSGGAPAQSARWDGENATVQVSLTRPGRIAVQRESLGELVGVGAAALPLVPVMPDLGVGIILGLPFQAIFELQSGLVTRELVQRSLPDLTVAAIRRLWPVDPGAPRVEVRLQIAGYGLVTRTAEAMTAFDTGTANLCLVALAELVLAKDGGAPTAERFDLGLTNRPPGAPTVTCATMGRMANPGSRWLARRIDEMAETLAMLVVQRVNALR